MKGMKRKTLWMVAMLMLLAVVSCDRRTMQERVQGAWMLADIDCRINGEEDLSARENIGESCYVFNSDSTYTLVEDDETEQGMWLCRDSLLGRCPDDETEYVWQRIERLTEDSLLLVLPDDTTEYGVVTEKRLFIRRGL